MFGNYDILEGIGQGGMGVVYRAHDVALDRIVALKVLKEDLRSMPQVVARFQREGEAFATLNHPNIVHIYSVGSVGKIPYIAMEYIEGEPLSKIMKREKRIPWQRALRIIEQVASALASAHENQIIHRDIKPGNILLDRDDQAFVTDFGIAKVLTAETQLTMDGTRLGTPQYMSPERCQNADITAASDIYSLGVVLFQMITARLPYEAATPVSLIRKITTEPPSRVREYLRDAPEDVERLVAHMIEKKPADRPSAEELARLCRRVLEGKPLVEDETGAAAAVRSFRESISTPTPYSSSSASDADSETIEYVPLADRARAWWARVPEGWKTAMFALTAVGAAALIGQFVTARLNRDYAIRMVQRTETGVTRWNQPAMVAEFTNEAPGISLVQLPFPEFRVKATKWLGDHILLELNGNPRSARDGHAALVLIDPRERSGYLAVPPIPGAGRPAFRLLDTERVGPTGQSADAPRAILAVEGAVPRLMTWSFRDGAGVTRPFTEFRDLATAVSGLAVSASQNRVAYVVAQAGSDGAWQLVARDMREGARDVVLSPPGAAIEYVQFTPAGDTVVYLRAPRRDARELWAVASDRTHIGGVKLATGAIRLVPGAVRPDGHAVVLVEERKSGNAIRVIDSRTGAPLADLGKGESAVWGGDGRSLLLTAPDARGRLQLWTVSADAPTNRRQLTYLDAGIEAHISIAPDGAWACAPVAERPAPAMVIVDLSRMNS